MRAGFLPITPWVKYCLHLHMDKFTEIVTSGLLEPVGKTHQVLIVDCLAYACVGGCAIL
ncbi:hypothetical protein DUNSADRAFT_13111 [Dunaliella salina]|uniref:Uncharacterized protein n=1 Tax=Dunaliella salina TaxID=3046 RepID=A0ABQ7FRA2_DUNSA|nr:hypothetical protein DUNSADRAFT_13111 [Dunaliella salina]|eukprot:KAF5825244.1 hypothetical protein DUNSADRAFT_13111 [Dunaliella salina]